MTYTYAFDCTNLGGLRLRRPAYETLYAAYRELRDALHEWNRRALENGALTGPYENEVDDLDRMIAWGGEQLAHPQAWDITVRGISVASARYAKAALVLTVKGGEKPDQRAEQNTATAAFGVRWSEGGRDEAGGRVSRKRREGVARPQFPAGGDAQIRSSSPCCARGFG